MELKINLADREDIAAAVPLLQLILDATPKTCGGQCHAHTGSIEGPTTTAPAADPATVFGNTVPLAPSGAPSFAGAVPLPTAPAVPAAISPETIAPVPPAPTSASAAAAPSVPAAPSTHAPAVELDSKGLPWDSRIHAGSKAKVKDGSWRMKKEIDAALVASVEAELRARVAASGASAAQPAVTPTGWPFPAETPVAPVAPVVPSVAADPTTFEQIMPRITAAVTAGTLPPTAVGVACAAVGLPSVVALQTNAQYVPHVWAALKQQYPNLA